MWLDISISTNKNSGQVYNLRGDNFVGEMLCFERENIPPPRLTGIKDYSKNVHWRLNTNRCVVIFLFLDLTHTKITFNKTFVFTFQSTWASARFFEKVFVAYIIFSSGLRNFCLCHSSVPHRILKILSSCAGIEVRKVF